MIRKKGWNLGTFFFCFWGKILVLTAALAAEMVSFWICISADLFDLFSVAGLPSVEDWDVDGVADGVGAAVEDEDDAGNGVGSAVIRSISVVPEESCINRRVRNVKREVRISYSVRKWKRLPPLILCCFVICEIVIAFSVLCSLLLCFCFFVTVRVANGENGLFPALFHYISK